MTERDNKIIINNDNKHLYYIMIGTYVYPLHLVLSPICAGLGTRETGSTALVVTSAEILKSVAIYNLIILTNNKAMAVAEHRDYKLHM